MTPWWAVPVTAVGVALAFSVSAIIDAVLVWRRNYLRKRVNALAEREAQARLREICETQLNSLRQHGLRYEIRVRDWGPGHGVERWRWAIFDADSLMEFTVDPQPATVVAPFEDGNAATRIDAEMQALAAIERIQHPVGQVWPQDEVTVVTRGVSGPHHS